MPLGLLETKPVALYLYFLREFYRSRAFAVMFLLIGGAAIALAFLTYFEYDVIISIIAPTPTSFSQVSPELKTPLINYIWSYIGVLIPPLAASFYSSTTISGDFESGAILPLLSLPVSKGTLMFSKLTASFTAVFLTISLYEVIQLVVVEMIIPGSSLYLFTLSYALMILFVFSCNSMAFAIGTFTNKGAQSTIIFLIVFYIVFNVISIAILLSTNSVPLYMLNNAGGIVDRVFADLNPVLFFTGGSISGARIGEILYSAEVMLLYSLFFVLVSFIGFTRSRRSL